MNKKNLVIVSLILVIIMFAYLFKAGLFHLTSQSTLQQGDKILVTTSFYPLYFFASQIGGDYVSIVNITPAGSEPHDYEPTPQDIVQIEKSKLLILNGGGLEVWGEKIKANLQGKKTVIITVGNDLITRDIAEDGQTSKDPHIWLSPPLAQKQVEKIAQTLTQVDPVHSTSYATNAQRLSHSLDELDQKYKARLANCKQKDIVTSHAAFGYLAQAYGLNQVAISGLSPDAEPSPAKLAEIAKFAKDKNIGYIFFESLVSPKFSETIAKEVGAKILVLNSIEGLTTEETQSGKNYISVMEDNLANLRMALQCQ